MFLAAIMVDDMQSRWEQRFSKEGLSYGAEPNEFLRQEISKLTPGKIWIMAEGEGRNVLWAASQGWDAHAFDYTEAGPQKALALAETGGLDITYQTADIQTVEVPEGEFDVIATCWFHLIKEVRRIHFPRVLWGLKKGGLFIMEAYHKDQLGKWSGGPQNVDLLFEIDDVLEDMCGENAPPMRVLMAERASPVLNEGELHKGEAATIQIILQRQ